MEQLLENGTEVLIFPYEDISRIKNNFNNYTIGYIVNFKDKEQSTDNELYEVLGEDGKLYYTNHKFPKEDIPYYIRTREEHLKSLNDYMSTNKEIIDRLISETQELQITIDTLNKEEKHKTR